MPVDLHSRAIMPREGIRSARMNLRDQYRLEGPLAREIEDTLELLNAVGVIALYDETFGAGAYLEHLRVTGNLRP